MPDAAPDPRPGTPGRLATDTLTASASASSSSATASRRPSSGLAGRESGDDDDDDARDDVLGFARSELESDSERFTSGIE